MFVARPNWVLRATRPTIVNDNRCVAILLKGLLVTLAIWSDKLLEARLLDGVNLGWRVRLLLRLRRHDGLLARRRGSHGWGRRSRICWLQEISDHVQAMHMMKDSGLWRL
jgi:hypothetical protein